MSAKPLPLPDEASSGAPAAPRYIRGFPKLSTPLFGGEDEIAAALTRLREPGVRLVTLTGIGGVGKTRLATEIAARVAEHDRRMVAYVPLADLRDPVNVVTAIAASLEIEPTGTRLINDEIAAAIGALDTLLVLDNFEHLLPAAGLVVELLAVCPALMLLVTSRVPLRLSGELLLPVPPLPASRSAEGFPAQSRFPAIRLFADRAAAVNPAFCLTAENASTVATICQRLDGLPLAIELAAARNRFLSPAAILTRLDDRLTLLSDGPRDALPRQQSMRAAIAWSSDLLTDSERSLFARLGIFVGGFTTEAADAVSAGPGTLDRLTALLDHGLVLPTANSLGEPRFVMLETIREYALKMLAASAEEETVCNSHAAYFVALGEAAEPDLMSADPTACCLRLQADLPNIRSAMTWLREIGRTADALRLLCALGWFWTDPPYITEGRAWYATLLDGVGEEIDPALRAKAWSGAGSLANHQGAHDASRDFYQRALTLWRQVGDVAKVGSTRRALGMIALRSGYFDEAEAAYGEALTSANATGDRWDIAAATQHLGQLQEARGDFDAAIAFYQEALTHWHSTGHLSRIQQALVALGWAHLSAGQLVCAWESFEAGLALMNESQDLNDVLAAVTTVHAGFAELARHAGNPGFAVSLYAAALANRAARHFPFDTPVQQTIDCRIAALRDRVGDAAFTVAWLEGWAWTLDEALVAARTVPRPVSPNDGGLRCGLSPREVDVLRLLVEGRGDVEIADALFISRKTASNHVAAIIDKLDVPNRTAAATLAVRRGIV